MVEKEPRAKQSGIIDRLDGYFRSEKTALAKTLRLLSSTSGNAYLHSKTKRVIDLSFGVPAAIVTTPLIIGFGVARKFEDGGPIFFVQEREGASPYEKVRVIKIRTMREDSDNGIINLEIAKGKNPDENPNNTRLGAVMRKFGIDELPQLWQVIKGEMSLVGIRALPEYEFDYLQQNWTEYQFRAWEETYRKSRLGIMSFVSAEVDLKGYDEQRFGFDMYYARKANLGLDLYLIWKCLIHLASKHNH